MIEADVELHGAFDGFDHLEKGDVAGRAGELISSVGAARAAHQAAAGEDLEDFGQEFPR